MLFFLTIQSPTLEAAPSCPRSNEHSTQSTETELHEQRHLCERQGRGATAQCRDGSYSFSQSRRGTCSHHRGVAKWL
ncbi:MAG: DUF3761 domain-containing protein [Candidatus Sulfotelmatobacter sp.]